MKRILSTILFTIFLVQARDIRLNLKTGLNIATLYGVSIDSLQDLGYKKTPTPGISGGVGLDITLTNRLSIEPELLLTMKGTEFTKNSNGVTDQFDVEYIYLSMPIIFKRRFEFDTFSLHLFIGPVPSLHLTSNFEMSLEGTADPDDEYDVSFDTKDITTNTDLGIVAGIGAEIPFGPGVIVVDARNTIGLRETRLYYDIWGSHSVFTLMAGYGFSLGK